MPETWPRWRALEPELLAAGLSYFALFSLAPLLLVVLTLSRANPDQTRKAQQLILDRASLWMSDDAVDSIQRVDECAALAAFAPGPHFFGLIIAAIAGSQVLGYMKRILNRIWNSRPPKKIPPWKDWLSYWVFNLLMLGGVRPVS